MLVLVTSALAILLCATAAGAVEIDTAELRTPSPAALSALIWKSYLVPPVRPVTLHAFMFVSLVLVLQAKSMPILPLAPSLRYTRYPRTGAPSAIAEVDHTSPMLSVDCIALDKPRGAGGQVDTSNAALRLPSPEALEAVTTKRYLVPPISPVSLLLTAEFPLPSYTTVSVTKSACTGGKKCSHTLSGTPLFENTLETADNDLIC
jgi:hypothetical protein